MLAQVNSSSASSTSHIQTDLSRLHDAMKLPNLEKYNWIAIVKNPFGLVFSYFISASYYLHVVLTSTDPSQQFSAPFQAGNSRQAQTCNIS